MPSPLPITPDPYPFLLRMVRSEKGWGDNSRRDEERIQDALATEFQLRDDGGFPPDISLFEVRDEIEFRRCVIALCAGRDKPPGTNFLYLPVSFATASAAGLSVVQSSGTTRCGMANAVHWDARGSATQVRAFYVAQHGATPEPRRVLKGELERLQSGAVAEGCAAAKDGDDCSVHNCPSYASTNSQSLPPPRP